MIHCAAVQFDTWPDADADDAPWACSPAPASLLLACDADGRCVELRSAAGVQRRWDDPLAALDWMSRHVTGQADPGARWVGHLSYDLGRLFESIPSIADDDLRLPLFAFTFHGGARAAAEAAPTGSGAGGREDAGCLSEAGSAGQLTSTFGRAQYERAVGRVIDYIAAGDIYQVNLSQRFTVPLSESPAAVYRRLQRRFGARFGALLDYGSFALICNSPELFLRITPLADGRRVLTRPIKGTRPRGTGMERALGESVKDQAELNMIVDLERNDLGRVCRIGSVRVVEPRTIETHPTVYHGVAGVEGVLRDEVGLVDLLRAVFPGGSITGAPKIRAMQIIEELEPTRRGPYCGAIGYLAADGSMQFNIAIRTMVAAGAKVHVAVGGGIVADSVPSEEYEETLVKARAMFAALGVSGQLKVES